MCSRQSCKLLRFFHSFCKSLKSASIFSFQWHKHFNFLCNQRGGGGWGKGGKQKKGQAVEGDGASILVL